MQMHEYECQLAQEELGEIIDECLQAQKRISKLNRFGTNEIMPGQDKNNADRLREEILDFMICVRFLEFRGLIRPINLYDVERAYIAKREKIQSNLQRSIDHARVNGTPSSAESVVATYDRKFGNALIDNLSKEQR